MAEQRIAVLSSRLRRFEDPERSRDPRVRSVVAQLKSLPPIALAPAPNPEFRAELRAQLVAIAPRIIADNAPAKTAERATAPNGAAEVSTPPVRRGLFARPLGIVGAVLTVCLLLLGGAVWESQRALPGDALYGLKRATEDVRLAFAGSDTARAEDYLGFAGTRVEEAQALVIRALPSAATGPLAGPRLSATTAALVRSTLRSADSDVRAASQLLTAQARESGSAAVLAPLRSWAPQQLRRLRELQSMLPPGPLRTRAGESAVLVHQAQTRATRLSAVVGRGCAGQSGRDQLGVQPCGSGPTQQSGSSQPGTGSTGPSGPLSSGPGYGGSHSRGPGAQHGRSGAHHGSGHRRNGPSGTTSGPGSSKRHGPPTSPLPTRPTLPTSSLPLPTSSLPLPTSSLPLPTSSLPLPTSSLPLPTSSLPLPTGGCTTLPLGITLGNCPSG